MKIGLSIPLLRSNTKPIEATFFRAMLEGYVSNKASLRDPTLPWAWTHLYYDKPWHVIDTWEKTKWTNQTGGVIRIYFEETPVWMMQYFGAYRPEVIEFLKIALFENYQSCVFHGGRGPARYSHENLEYINTVADGSSFKNYHGQESVYRDDKLLGEHRYHGGLMI